MPSKKMFTFRVLLTNIDGTAGSNATFCPRAMAGPYHEILTSSKIMKYDLLSKLLKQIYINFYERSGLTDFIYNLCIACDVCQLIQL